MSYETISLAERKRLRAKRIRKHNLPNIVTHWFNVAVWLLMVPTGFAIISSPRLSLSPKWLQEMMRNLFGRTANLITFHATIGLIWTVVLVFNVLVGFRKYFLPWSMSRMLLNRDDLAWLKIKPLQMLGFMKDRSLPPQDAYNAGQKLYMYLVVIAIPVIMVTGVIMTFRQYFPPLLKQISQPIHFLAVGGVLAGLIIHIYMAALFPEEKEAFFSMFTGNVSAWYAREHHERWYWEKVQEEMAWEEEVSRHIISATGGETEAESLGD
jgi:formate dehydrogenase subunit gamma